MKVMLQIISQKHTFVKSNAPCHAARLTLRNMNHFGIEMVQWSARSPDLNPIEQLWWYLKHHIYDYIFLNISLREAIINTYYQTPR